jgi:hypothetical protein
LKRLIGLCILILGVGFAQSPVSPYYAGGGLNLGLLPGACVPPPVGECYGGFSFGVAAHGGARDLLTENLGLRGSLSFGFASNVTLFKFGVDAVYDIEMEGSTLQPYAGGGLRLGYAGISSGFGVGYGGFVAGLGFLGGAAFPITPDLAAFGELNLDLPFGVGFLPSLVLGVRFNF